MNKLLQFEFRRLFRAKYFYICIAVSFVLVLMTAAIDKLLYNAMLNAGQEAMDAFGEMGATIPKPAVLDLLKQIGSSSTTLILAVFVSIFVTEDYTSDVIKNIYAKGYSRGPVFASKGIATLAGGLCIILANAVFSLAIGAALFPEFGTAGKNYAAALIGIVFILVAYIGIYFTLSIIFRKVGSSIALSIFAPLIIRLLLNLLDLLIKSEKVSVADYWLDGRLTALTATDVSGKALLSAFLVAGGVIIAAGVVGYFLNEKRES